MDKLQTDLGKCYKHTGEKQPAANKGLNQFNLFIGRESSTYVIGSQYQ